MLRCFYGGSIHFSHANLSRRFLQLSCNLESKVAGSGGKPDRTAFFWKNSFMFRMVCICYSGILSPLLLFFFLPYGALFYHFTFGLLVSAHFGVLRTGLWVYGRGGIVTLDSLFATRNGYRVYKDASVPGVLFLLQHRTPKSASFITCCGTDWMLASTHTWFIS